MNTLRMLLAEIGYRKLNFALSLFAVVIAISLLVAGPMLIEGYSQATEAELEGLKDRVTESAAWLSGAEAEAAAELAELEDQTRRVMRDLGFNLTILHRDTDTIAFLSTGLPSVDMPQEFIDRLAADPSLTMVTHLVATLRAEIDFNGHRVRLVGYLPETPQSHKPLTKFAQKLEKMKKKKTPMGYDIAPGSVQLGYALGKGALGQGLDVGQTIDVLGRSFRIATILPEKGIREDATIAMHLTDAQQLLNKPHQINQILALECRCVEADLAKIRHQIGQILPQVHIIRDMSKANARSRQRAMVQQKHQRIIAKHQEALEEREQTLDETIARKNKIQSLMGTLANIVTPLVVLACGLWVGLLALANVRERRTEIGILRSLGKGSATIAGLFLGKAVLLGLIGAAVGFALGSALALGLGLWAWKVPPGQIGLHYGVLLVALIGAPALSAAASYLPTLAALKQDPAVVLRDH